MHEYVSYTLLRDAGIPVPKFNVAKTQDEAVKYAQELNTKDIVLKAQVRIFFLILKQCFDLFFLALKFEQVRLSWCPINIFVSFKILLVSGISWR